MEATFTAPSETIRNAVQWVAPCAGNKSQGVEWLTTVQLTTKPVMHYERDFSKSEAKGVTLAATDRYRLSYATIPTEGYAWDEDVAIYVPATELIRAVRGLSKKYGAQATVTVTDKSLSISENGSQVTIQTFDMTGSYPKWHALVPDAAAEPTSAFALNGKLLGSLVKAAANIDSGALRFGVPPAPYKPVIFSAGNTYDSTRYSGLLMPFREA